MTALLEIDNVRKTFRRAGGPPLAAVDDVSLTVAAGETVGIIGESGSGKSTLARLALSLLDCDAGEVRFDGVELSRLGHRDRRTIRLRMTAVFQEPFESLNPRMRVGAIVAEPLTIHRLGTSRRERTERAAAALERVGLGAAFLSKYPAQMSGGQQQRVSLARAIVTEPKLVVLDEPTSSLDLSVQAQVLRQLIDLREALGVAYLFITHDIAVAEYLCHRIAVMCRGRIVETQAAADLLSRPQHEYTQQLLSSALSPTLSPDGRTERDLAC